MPRHYTDAEKRLVLDRLTNRAFLMWTRGLGVAVGAVYLVHGVYLLLYAS